MRKLQVVKRILGEIPNTRRTTAAVWIADAHAGNCKNEKLQGRLGIAREKRWEMIRKNRQPPKKIDMNHKTNASKGLWQEAALRQKIMVWRLLYYSNAARWSPPSRTRPCIVLSRSIFLFPETIVPLAEPEQRMALRNNADRFEQPSGFETALEQGLAAHAGA